MGREDAMLAQLREDYAHDRISMLELEERIEEILKREGAVVTNQSSAVGVEWQTQMLQRFNEPFVAGGCGMIIAPLILAPPEEDRIEVTTVWY